MPVRVQVEDFDVSRELAALRAGDARVGAVAAFIGTVRDVNDASAVATMTLEHYPGMTERQLAAIAGEACQRWPLDACLIIHRHGRLLPGERIVLVATASAHREAALASCAFLIDWLKTRAPFWKLEDDGRKQHWVEASQGDDVAAAKWLGDDARD